MLNNYINYLRDNPKKQWFKAKLYGWGWTPATWQGWLIILISIGLIILTGVGLDSKGEPTTAEIVKFFVTIFIIVSVLLFICYKTGEKPRWQWGLPKKSDKNKN